MHFLADALQQVQELHQDTKESPNNDCAKPSAQFPKHIKSLQDDTKHAVMKPETSMNWSNHKNVHYI